LTVQTRKFLFITLSFLSTLSLVGCGGGDDSSPVTGTGGSAGTGGSSGTGGGTPGTGGIASTGCNAAIYASYQAPTTTPTLATDVYPIFRPTCAVGGCHLTPATGGIGQHPYLGPGTDSPTAAQLAAIKTELLAASVEGAASRSIKLVVPGQPENSYLMVKIEADPAVCNAACIATGCMARMPALPGLTVPPAQVKTIRDWIKAGAN
jgi:hypothetical protein